jgi:HK97 family phage portal protein
MMQGHLELRGNAYAEIVSGNGRAIDALIPLHPDRVRVVRLPNARLRYEVRYNDGQMQNFAQEEIFHLRGFSSDGVNGLSTITLARESVGASLAQQEYASRFFANDSTPRGVLEFPGKMKDEGFERMKKEWQASQTGGNRHKTALLEEGLKYTAIGVSNKDSQFLEARGYTRGEIASVFRVPPHKIGDLSNAHFTNIEQQNIEFITDSIYPRVKRFESRISKDLIVPLGIGDTGEYFAEFLLDAQLRGDQKTRYESYALGRQWGFLSVNDVRRLENMNPVPDGDEYLNPMNMIPLGTQPPAKPSPKPGQDARLREFALAAAQRVVRKEVKAIGNAFAKANGNLVEFKKSIQDFYAAHGSFVAETMRISTWRLRASTSSSAEAIAIASRGGLDSNAEFLIERPLELAELALGERQ